MCVGGTGEKVCECVSVCVCVCSVCDVCVRILNAGQVRPCET